MTFLWHDGHLVECALWNRKRGRNFAGTPRILIVNPDVNVGESMVLLLGLKGFPSRLATNQMSALTVLDQWRPQFVFLDTRIGKVVDSDLVGEIGRRSDQSTVMVIAMSRTLPEESAADIRDAGYDGHLRRPCPIWQMADFLNNFFTCA